MRAAFEGDARDMQARWHCPAAGHVPGDPLDPDLRHYAEQAARLMGTSNATTCPFACVMHADPWVIEITTAVGLAQPENGATPLETTLGRDLTRADVQALAVLARAKSDVWKSDQAIREQQQKTRPKG